MINFFMDQDKVVRWWAMNVLKEFSIQLVICSIFISKVTSSSPTAAEEAS
jgi:hypothetical protein